MLDIKYLNARDLTGTQRENGVKFKKVSRSLSAHRRKESKEPTNVKNGPAKLSKNEHIQTDRRRTDYPCIYK